MKAKLVEENDYRKFKNRRFKSRGFARGDEKIAILKQEEINKHAIYDTNQRAIDSIKLQMKLLENQLAREYGNAGNEI